MNQSTTAAVASRIPLKIEDAPPFGQGVMPIEQERTFAMLSHLFPLVIWLWKRRSSAVVDAHGKESMNFSITMFICSFGISIVASFLGTAVALIAGLVLMVMNICVIALVVYAMIQANNGRLLRYPVNFRLIK